MTEQTIGKVAEEARAALDDISGRSKLAVLDANEQVKLAEVAIARLEQAGNAAKIVLANAKKKALDGKTPLAAAWERLGLANAALMEAEQGIARATRQHGEALREVQHAQAEYNTMLRQSRNAA